MNIAGVLAAAAVVGVIGLICGILLGIASEKFSLADNHKVSSIRAVLPGINCGGCGFPGCDGLAAAIAAGQARVNACPVGGAKVADKIAAIVGIESSQSKK